VRDFIGDASERWRTHKGPVQRGDGERVLLGAEVVLRTQSFEQREVQCGQDLREPVHQVVELTKHPAQVGVEDLWAVGAGVQFVSELLDLLDRVAAELDFGTGSIVMNP
jgi:hypothetical protein